MSHDREQDAWDQGIEVGMRRALRIATNTLRRRDRMSTQDDEYLSAPVMIRDAVLAALRRKS